MIEMDEMKIKLSALWVALMLIYLLGDVLRIMSGDPVTPGEIQGEKVGQWVWLGMAAMMLIPIAMVILSVFLNYPVNRWANIIVAIIVVVFNVISLPYPSVFDNFLIFVSIGVNALTIWLAWKWV
jgi:hypothetical protein